MIELTKSEAEALAELLDTALYDTIRGDEGIDSLDWQLFIGNRSTLQIGDYRHGYQSR